MRRELGMLAALIVLCIGLAISNNRFVSQDNVVNTGKQIAMLGIFATGVAFVIVTGGIDLSVGSVIGLTGVLIAKISSNATGGMGHSLWVGIPVALAIALAIGLIQGLLITRLDLQPFIVTLGFMLLIRGVSQVICGGGVISLGDSPLRSLAFEGPFNLNNSFFVGHPVRSYIAAVLTYPVVIYFIVAIIAAYLLHFTVFGRYVYAIGGSRDAAEYSGLPVKRVETLTYVISAGLAGVAGICAASYSGQMSHQIGISYELAAIAAAVIGGVSLRGGEGSILGVLIGSAIMRVIQNGINLFKWTTTEMGKIVEHHLGSEWTDVVTGSVILIAVILDQLVHIIQHRRRVRRAGDMARQREQQSAAQVEV
jgi:ribose transport system permease protein